MKVILREDVPDIGEAGQVVDVKTGYGRNYLLPRNLAIPATKANLKAIDEVNRQQEARRRKARRGAEVLKDKIEKLSITAEVLVTEEEKVYGSVGIHDILELMEKEGVTVAKSSVQLESPIKDLGVFTIPIKVDKEITAELKLWVVKKT